jgi:hypothetical protein
MSWESHWDVVPTNPNAKTLHETTYIVTTPIKGNKYELDLYQMIRLLIFIDSEAAKEIAKVCDLYPYYQAIVNESEIKEVA